MKWAGGGGRGGKVLMLLDVKREHEIDLWYDGKNVKPMYVCMSAIY